MPSQPTGMDIRRRLLRNWDAFLLCFGAIFYVFLAPFTKVEESFNVQATFDLLYKRWGALSDFDHVTFPGVVPRTFLGPLVLHLPVALALRLAPLSPLGALRGARLALAALSVGGLLLVRAALRARHSALVGTLFAVLTAAQFHQLFYAGRLLPNVLALVLANAALALRVRGGRRRLHWSYMLLATAVAVFRSELSILLFWAVAVDALRGRARFAVAAGMSLLAAGGGALLSVAVDTLFWGALPGAPLGLRYPELEVFHFNAVLGKSAAWGVSPPHWYFSHALPRALGLALLLAVPGAALGGEPVAGAVLPHALFVATYSALPHKELRFVFYALPAANVAAAHALAALARRALPAAKGKPRRALLARAVAAAAVAAAPAASAAITAVSAAASRANYPGAHALLTLREVATCARPLRAHIDAHAASTGVSQFVEAAARCPGWIFSRAEGLADAALRRRFTHLVGARAAVRGFRVVHAQRAFAGIDWRRLRFRYAPVVFVLERVAEHKVVPTAL